MEKMKEIYLFYSVDKQIYLREEMQGRDIKEFKTIDDSVKGIREYSGNKRKYAIAVDFPKEDFLIFKMMVNERYPDIEVIHLSETRVYQHIKNKR